MSTELIQKQSGVFMVSHLGTAAPNRTKFEAVLNGIQVSILYNSETHKYVAQFVKQGDYYFPMDYLFQSYYWEGLLQDIEGEMRTPEFAQYLGTGNRFYIYQTLEKIGTFCLDC